MSATATDTSVLVAGLLGWHESHAPSLVALKTARTARELIVPLPALVESYAVMTRLPPPHRLAPEAALDLLSGSLEGSALVVGLDGPEAWSLLRALADARVTGGGTYDALILACAWKARAARLLTLDADFERLDTRGIEIVIPT